MNILTLRRQELGGSDTHSPPESSCRLPLLNTLACLHVPMALVTSEDSSRRGSLIQHIFSIWTTTWIPHRMSLNNGQ
ncbi:hypothetical protein DMENIID0001_083790 [Sergentomyia squamirostris]